MQKDSHIRSIVKSVSWRVTATITTIILVYLFTGTIELALAIGGVEVVAKMFIYFLHERLWDRLTFGKKEIKPVVIWFTGLSGSGKTTISKVIEERIRSRKLRVQHLDGDAMRAIFPGTGFSKEERDAHIRRVGLLCSMLEKNGVIVVASFVSPYRETRDFVRNLCHNFIEVYISTPLEVCEKRDVKGLYAKARSGEIKNFTGISDPYEEPKNPELSLDTSNISETEAIENVMAYLESHFR